MTTGLLTLFAVGFVLCLAQFLAALPWLAAVDRLAFFGHLRRPVSWAYALGGLVVGGALVAVFLRQNADPGALSGYGRLYAALLQVQLSADFFVLVLGVALAFWSKG